MMAVHAQDVTAHVGPSLPLVAVPDVALQSVVLSASYLMQYGA